MMRGGRGGDYSGRGGYKSKQRRQNNYNANNNAMGGGMDGQNQQYMGNMSQFNDQQQHYGSNSMGGNQNPNYQGGQMG